VEAEEEPYLVLWEEGFCDLEVLEELLYCAGE
jgi:hypothetical protein